jgi:hypothetical protein
MMGMLFNTDDTLEMAKYVHKQFRSLWTMFQSDPLNWASFFQSLGTGSTYAAISVAPLDLDATLACVPNLSSNKSARWQAWLNILDGAGVTATIGGHIADAILNKTHNFSGVEFHLVPAARIAVSHSHLPDHDPTKATSTLYTKVITINTVTWDNLHPV